MDTKMKPPFATESLPISVNGNDLSELLHALTGPGHLIRELQVLAHSSLPMPNPISNLITDLNRQIEEQAKIGSQFGWLVFPSISALHSLFEIGYSRFLYNDELKQTNPPIFGRKSKAIEYATQLRDRKLGPVSVVCIALDDFRYEEAGDYVWPERDIKIRPERVLGTDVTILR